MMMKIVLMMIKYDDGCAAVANNEIKKYNDEDWDVSNHDDNDSSVVVAADENKFYKEGVEGYKMIMITIMINDHDG